MHGYDRGGLIDRLLDKGLPYRARSSGVNSIGLVDPALVVSTYGCGQTDMPAADADGRGVPWGSIGPARHPVGNVYYFALSGHFTSDSELPLGVEGRRSVCDY
jgi:hypothetical protein